MSPAGTALGFFARHAEAEGALVDVVPGGVLLVLPEELRRSFSLPEVVGLTEDPEVAREDGLVLLGAGHPLLRTAAQSVLERGDIGCSHLPRPPELPPAATVLESRARERIQPAHGRVDIVRAPVAIYIPVLRVGALLTYRISIDEQVQELEEAWVLADTGTTVPPALEGRLRSAPCELGCPPGLEPFAGAGVHAADERLRTRANGRSAELARQASTRLASQLAVVDDYYNRVLASIDERKARANEARAALLEDQAGATTAEWARRRREVAEDLTPTFELRPFRMHLLAVPAYRVQADVRRGSRTYPLSLTYVPLVSSFLTPRCPACAAEAPLVAGKQRLGCSECLAAPASGGSGPPALVVLPSSASRPGTAAIASSPQAAPVTRRATSSSGAPGASLSGETSSGPSKVSFGGTKGSCRPPKASSGSPKGSSGRVTPKGSSGRVTPKGSSGRVTPKGSSGDGSLSRTGHRLAVSFWESVLSGDRIKARDVLAASPLEALLRLYGPRGPGLVVALRDGEVPRGFSAATFPSETHGLMETAGELRTSIGREVRFAIFWRSRPATQLVEIEGLPLDRIGSLFVDTVGFGAVLRRRLSEYLAPAPPTSMALELEASELLRRSASLAGLGYAMRCMAAWWYVIGQADRAPANYGGAPAGIATAAAVETVVAKRAGLRLTASAAAERYACPVAIVRSEVRRLEEKVRGCESGW